MLNYDSAISENNGIFMEVFTRLCRNSSSFISFTLKKGGSREWNPQLTKAVIKLKQALASAPVLVQPHYSQPLMLEPTVTEIALAPALGQHKNQISPLSY